MSEEYNFRNCNRFYLATGAGVCALLLAGCSTSEERTAQVESILNEISPVNRAIFDYTFSGYVNGWQVTDNTNGANRKSNAGCLLGSAYDLTAGQKGQESYTPPTATYDVATDQLMITPASGEDPLILSGFDQAHVRTWPADKGSEKILDAHGCVGAGEAYVII